MPPLVTRSWVIGSFSSTIDSDALSLQGHGPGGVSKGTFSAIVRSVATCYGHPVGRRGAGDHGSMAVDCIDIKEG